MVQGTREGYGFVLHSADSADIFLPPHEMRAVLHQDKVRVRIVRHDKKGRPEGRVCAILERPHCIVGRLIKENSLFLVTPDDVRITQDILIPKKALNKAKVGQMVVAELTSTPALHTQPVGRVQEVLGAADDPGMEIEIALRKFDLPHRFSPDTLKAVQRLPKSVRPQDRQSRVDLRNLPLVTIDGEDARDFDDAVYCEPVKVGRRKAWRLLVAVADVSHYVRPGSSIDSDAYARATSVYFPRRVIPMLPEELCNGLCSLMPEVERLCMVCDMRISNTGGTVEAYQFYPALMFSHARLTYSQVAAVLEENQTKNGQTQAVQSSQANQVSKDLRVHLQHMDGVYQSLARARQRRGALDFETSETQMVFDAKGHIQQIKPRQRNRAHKIIEEAMLAANVCAADFILHHGHKALFRIHDAPSPEKREALQNYLRALGLSLTLPQTPSAKDYQAIAEKTKARPDALQIHTMLLRSMQQAVYSHENKSHFGLAYTTYTHFTSPIRRYPDLLVHRVIKSIVHNNTYAIGRRNKNLSWQSAAVHSSQNERRADEASRDVEGWLKCKYMQQHLGEVFEATVSAVTSFGLFVLLDQVLVEGLVHITELGKEYFAYDGLRHELCGARSGTRYTLGSKLRVQVARVDEQLRRIDLRPMQPPT